MLVRGRLLACSLLSNGRFEDVAGVEPGFAADIERVGNQEFRHDMVLAKEFRTGW